MSADTDFIAAQSTRIHTEEFQSQLISSIAARLLSAQPPPCLLRAPTGSGKTYVISMILESVTHASPTIWFWFVPFSNLVQQTEDSIAANTTGLTPIMLSRGRNQDPKSGMVVLSTAQAVAKATSRNKGYRDGEDDEMRSLADQVALARARNLKIGLVVDEAHIGLDSQTEFGKFAHWLQADRLIMATATPRDQRISDFLANAGYADCETFSVSRDEVVDARLNKRYIETVIYDLRDSMQTITDLQRTVLRQGWRRNRHIQTELIKQNVPVVPLLLVQVGNGEGTVEAAVKFLMQDCHVQQQEIGMHSSDAPNPVLMASIANDSTKRVLVFKQSAGTGFDAPRAFVLVSTKNVNDPDFAMQFVGRVMRVTRQIRSSYPKPILIPDEFDTAYVYLANMEAQAGFEQAVAATAQVKSQLEGQSEKLVARRTLDGGVAYTNRTTNQPMLPYGPNLQYGERTDTLSKEKPVAIVDAQSQPDMFDEDIHLDRILPDIKATSVQKRPPTQTTREGLLNDLSERGIQSFSRRVDLVGVPICLKREWRPEMADMSEISRSCASRLNIPDDMKDVAVRAALDRQKEREIHKELITKTLRSEDVLVITDRVSLAKEARIALSTLPQVEEEDANIIIHTLSQRMRPDIASQFEHLEEFDENRPDEQKIIKWARDAAHMVIRKLIGDLEALLHEEIATRAHTMDAGHLPEAMLFPAEIALEASFRNIYGVLPPSEDDIERVPMVLVAEDRAWLKDETYSLNSGESVLLSRFDFSGKLNGEERDFARALDRAEFVRWWHRNSDRKPWSVALVRGEHKNYFYPDFVICLDHFPGDEPLLRLVDTKENTKDAARKLKHTPNYYGKVLFLTKDGKKIKWVKDDGSLGDQVDFDNLNKMRDWLRISRPARQR
ncbi:type III restriction enzyme [Undibacterium sp. GrIS 1.2]|uniref:DEAD/DEAH box helicase n=1 Tax=Undibacterium sp. GrIS 1.2 TaxID=3143933 RepID=UPI0033925DC3